MPVIDPRTGKYITNITAGGQIAYPTQFMVDFRAAQLREKEIVRSILGSGTDPSARRMPKITGPKSADSPPRRVMDPDPSRRRMPPVKPPFPGLPIIPKILPKIKLPGKPPTIILPKIRIPGGGSNGFPRQPAGSPIGGALIAFGLVAAALSSFGRKR